MNSVHEKGTANFFSSAFRGERVTVPEFSKALKDALGRDWTAAFGKGRERAGGSALGDSEMSYEICEY